MNWPQNRDTIRSLRAQWGCGQTWDLAAQDKGGGEFSLLPWRVFETPQPSPPKETRLGRGGFFTSLFSPFPSLFTTPSVPAHCGRG